MISQHFFKLYLALAVLIFSIGMLFVALTFATEAAPPTPRAHESTLLPVLPTETETDTRRNTGSQLLEGIQAMQISDLSMNTMALNQGALTHGTLEQDSNNSTPYDNLTDGVFFITTTVSTEGYSLIAATINSSVNNFALFVGRDNNGDGMPDASEQLCTSSTPTAIEICELVNPVSGTYWIMVQNRVASISPPDFVTLITAVVYNSPTNPPITETLPNGTIN